MFLVVLNGPLSSVTDNKGAEEERNGISSPESSYKLSPLTLNSVAVIKRALNAAIVRRITDSASVVMIFLSYCFRGCRT